ncbi:ABC transporter ATP-binding protein [Vagococcus elongatus]|uniref:ABC transporter ATP-binding protein n=1 Tax=Vagococcus elongatus TaxID=180344 RepID=A0A430AHP3_9ENTE|nr:ABC transporter ATP-binding protein [Vagococcus elongatus]RSU07612.1 ABC transporter ATP-binding protein [Vagococcus elongatus]
MNAIEIHRLTKKFGKQIAVDGIDLEVKQGEIFGFIGPNGAGKSTTIKILLNLIFPTEGKALIFGHDCIKESVAIKRFTGYVTSEVRLYNKFTSLDIFNYVSEFHGLKDSRKEIEDYVQLFEIDLKKKFSELSFGNKKKVALVAAFLPNPKLLILDEPTNGLDPKIQARFFEVLKHKQEEGMTTFLSSHDLHEVQNHCERVAFIKNGVIAAVENLHEKKSFIKKITLTGEQIPFEEIMRIGGKILGQGSNRLVFTFDGEFSKLFHLLENVSIQDIDIRDVDLEERFLSMYE